MEQSLDGLLRCRHILGGINGYCITCNQKMDAMQHHYNAEMRRMIGSNEGLKEVSEWQKM